MEIFLGLILTILLFGTPVVLITQPKWYKNITKDTKNPNIKTGFIALGLFLFIGAFMPPESTQIDKTNSEQITPTITEKTAEEKEAELEKEIKELITKMRLDQDNSLFDQIDKKIKKLPDEKQTILYADLQLAKIHNDQAGANTKVMNSELYSVIRVVDGDTIHINIDGKTEKVRIIGLDTPEVHHPSKPIQCFGREASQKMKDLINGKQIRIEQDPTQAERDKYGRLLLHIFTAEGENIAYKMISEGYAHEYTYRIPYKYQNQYKKAQKTAEQSDLGLWSPNTCNGNTKKPAYTPPKPKPQPKPVYKPKSKSTYKPPAPQPAPNGNLPLKAICKDGTIQYQDHASLPNYRGMCSGHGGIRTKLGRVP